MAGSVSRVLTRALLVGGFAGAAWFLSSSAAQAAGDAEQVPEQTTSVVTVDGPLTALDQTLHPLAGTASQLIGTVLTPVNTVVAPGDKSLDAAAGAVRSHPARPAVAPVPARSTTITASVASQAPVRQEAHDQPVVPVVRNGADRPTGRVDLVRSVHNLVAPLGFAEVVSPVLSLLQPMIGILDPVIVPLGDALRPVLGGLRATPTPGTALGAVTGPMADIMMRSTAGAAGQLMLPPVHHAVSPGPTGVLAEALHARTPAQVNGITGAAHQEAAPARAAPVAGRSTMTGTRQVSDLPQRTPSPAYPGSGNTGISTTASGSHQDGGGFAIVPATVASSRVADHRLLGTTGVVARRLIAEAPTFSPD